METNGDGKRGKYLARMRRGTEKENEENILLKENGAGQMYTQNFVSLKNMLIKPLINFLYFGTLSIKV